MLVNNELINTALQRSFISGSSYTRRDRLGTAFRDPLSETRFGNPVENFQEVLLFISFE